MPDSRSEHEDEAIQSFLNKYFPATFLDRQSTLPGYGADDGDISDEEEEEIEALVDRVDHHFSRSKGTLGVAIDFLMVAEQISQADDWLQGFNPDITRDDIFNRYENTAKTSLTLKHGDTRYSIRSVHNGVIEIFREDLNRTNFPSSPGHHTGEWERYDDMLEYAFRLSRAGRYEAAQRLFDLGLDRLAAKDYLRREPPFPDVFSRVLQDYKRSAPFEEGGSAYQALCYGYVKAKWPHLSLRASKVRTGSSRQQRYGDIDGYYGPDLMISVEVKDLDIDRSNVSDQLGTMMGVGENTTAISIAICREISDDARDVLDSSDVEAIDDDHLATELRTWDYHKQNRALQGMIHFFANIEENPEAVQRLLRFVREVDSENSSLVHLVSEDDESV
ncbi:hypothetical protein [Halorarius litoreus]|uniref:hypothetical protein n=1 Tax=Halorarius litoreus TaxID=2962676 RepID=UPI0020CCCBB5|nr:hypothetical protein [Halorarius litoreus]